MRVTIDIAIRTTNPLNGSGGFSPNARFAAARRKKEIRTHVADRVSYAIRDRRSGITLAGLLPALVTITRVAPSSGLDPHDGLPASLKSVVDGIADALGLKSDRDPRVEWQLRQRRGLSRQYGVEIVIAKRDCNCTTCADASL